MAMKPLASTLRTLDWDDLPASVREIPDSFDPFGDGVLMKHQAECLALEADIIAIPKGRRTGITFSWGLNSVLIAAASKSAGGDNVYYIGDTKEKGLEFIGYAAKFSRVIAEQQSQEISSIEEFLFEDQDENGNTRYINAYRIRHRKVKKPGITKSVTPTARVLPRCVKSWTPLRATVTGCVFRAYGLSRP